jgi:hypothetical protein
MGAGPMTGGARGLCNPATAGAMRAYGGYGYGRGLGIRRGFRGGYGAGRGWGRGFGRGYIGYPTAVAPAFPVDAPDEIDMLKSQAASLKASLDAVNRRIDELSNESSE